MAPWLIALLGLFATWQAWTNAHLRQHTENQTLFDAQVRDSVSVLKLQMRRYEQLLYGIDGLYAASKSVEQDEFHQYVDKQNFEHTMADIHAIGFIPLLTAQEKQTHIEAMRHLGLKNYNIYPAGERPQYAAVTFLATSTERNQSALGFDMYADPVRRQAMNQARDTAKPAMSGAVTLISDDTNLHEQGVLIFLPLYRKNAPLEKLEEKRANLMGWGYIAIHTQTLLHNLQKNHPQNIQFSIHDRSTEPNTLLLASSRQPTEDHHGLMRLQSNTSLLFAGRTWQVSFQAQPEFSDAMAGYRAHLIAVAGVSISLMLGLLIHLLMTGRARAEKTAQTMNHALIESEAHLRHQSQRLSEVIWGTNVGTWEWHIQSGEILFNQRWAEMLGYTLAELMPTSISTWEKLADPNDLKIASQHIEHYFHHKDGTYECEIRMRHKDGRWLWMLDRGRVVEWDAQGKPIRMSGTHQDISAHKETEKKLQLAASVFTNAREAILITDAEANFLEINKTFSEITGYSPEDVRGKNFSDFKNNLQTPEFYAQMWDDLHEQGFWIGELWNKRKNGEIFAERLTISIVRNDLGEIQNYVSLFTDITHLKEQQIQLERIAHFDALTGLPNRVLFADRLKLALAQSQRHSKILAVAYLDLDGFKAVNDTYGHNVGDELLIAVTQRMKGVLREGDTLARVGGDEFVAILVDLEPPQHYELIIERLLQVTAQAVIVQNHTLHVSASIGITIYPEDPSDADRLVRHADQAMYRAKKSGKNRYCLFSEDL